MINAEAIARIDATLLPQLDRHHLRLLYHCLDSFRAMTAEAGAELPNRDQRRRWCEQQSVVAGDPNFVAELLQQFDSAAAQLEALADQCNKQPLELSLDDLIKEAEVRARHCTDSG